MVADILFFQKRDRAAITEPDWVQLKTTPEGYTVNSYFADHPEMVLGDFTTESTQYGKQEVTVKAKEGADLAEQLKDAVQHIQGTITEQSDRFRKWADSIGINTSKVVEHKVTEVAVDSLPVFRTGYFLL